MPSFTAGEKEAIRLWYEYYKVARASPQPFILATLSSSRGFYEPWEVEKYETFNDWWKDKKGLFAAQSFSPQHQRAWVLEPDETITGRIPKRWIAFCVQR